MHDQGEVIVIGGANIDVKARPSHVMKSATSNPGSITISIGGVARNIAHNLALLGCRTALATRLGMDDEGDRLWQETSGAGVDLSMTMRSSSPTGIYCAVLDLEGELAIAVNSMAIMEELSPAEVSRFASRLRAASFLVADCNLPQETLNWLADFAADTRQRLVIEAVSVPKTEKILALLQSGRQLYAVTPNLYQSRAMTGIRIEQQSDAFEAARRISGMGVDMVVITLGEQGVYVHSLDESAHVPPHPGGGPVDVTGAGDAMTAGLIFGLLHGFAPLAAARLGQAAARLTISSPSSVSQEMSSNRLLAMTGLAIEAAGP